jgi:hypothetical protein
MLGMPGSAQMARAEAAGLFHGRRERGLWRQGGAGAGRCAGGWRDGAVIGAVGVTGDTSDNDAAAAVAGIAAAGFEARA